MTRVCVVGVGLIGGSLGLSLRRSRGRRAYHVIGLGRDARALAAARRRGAIDEFTTDPASALRDADIVVFCVPVQTIVSLAIAYAPFFKRGAVVTDAGSVKGDIVDGMKKALMRRRDVAFVGAHPMAGSDKTGVENAQPDLFDGATCVIASPASATAAARVRRLWQDAGARCVTMDAHRHDDVIALTSHLPHLLAFALFSLVSARARRDRHVRDLVAGSFRDMTRVAGSSPDVWSGIFESNRKALERALTGFTSVVGRLNNSRGAALFQELRRLAREKRSWST